MDAANEMGYRPPPEFREDVRDPLIELSLTDSSELWLIQWPINQAPDFDGQELSLKLHRDGLLGSFQGSSGKSYDVVSFKAQDPNATVFLSSASESKIVGKISRRISIVHYPEPSELEKQHTTNQRHMYQKSTGTSLTNSSHRRATPSQGTRPISSHSGASKRSSKSKSSLSEVGEASKPPKKSRVEEPTRSMEQQSTQGSGRGHSVFTSSGSLGHSEETKSKKKKKKKHEK